MYMADAIDIVVLNCNNDVLIQNSIASIISNTNGRYNLIVVDQDSKDGTKEWLIENKPAAHLILNKRNVGMAEGWNQGIRAGRYPWIAFVHSDTVIMDPEWLDKMWNYTIDRRIGMIEARISHGTWDGEMRYGGMAFCLIRRQCLNEVGYFDKQFIVGPDLDWFVRLEWSWWKTAYCPDTNVLHIGNGTMQACLKTKAEELTQAAYDILKLKYTALFLEKTLVARSRRRMVLKEELLHGTNGRDAGTDGGGDTA